MMMNAFFPAMALMVLVGCSIPSPVQKAQRVKVDPLRSLNMEALCKDQAAKRYNTSEQKIDVTAFEQFQGSYEMRGYTFRKEQFVCSFDADGHFLHLSMRFVLYIFHPAGILIPSFKSTRIQHEIICKSLIPGPSRA